MTLNTVQCSEYEQPQPAAAAAAAHTTPKLPIRLSSTLSRPSHLHWMLSIALATYLTKPLSTHCKKYSHLITIYSRTQLQKKHPSPTVYFLKPFYWESSQWMWRHRWNVPNTTHTYRTGQPSGRPAAAVPGGCSGPQPATHKTSNALNNRFTLYLEW